MAAGRQFDASSINAQAAQAVTGVRDALNFAMAQYNWLNALGPAGIEATPAPPASGASPISSEDASTILAALADLAGLCQIFNGVPCTIGFGQGVATGAPYSFMTFGKLLTAGQ